jgi:hypothetical protein
MPKISRNVTIVFIFVGFVGSSGNGRTSVISMSKIRNRRAITKN